MDYKPKYGENTKAGKAERALAKCINEGVLGCGAMAQYLYAADEASLERLYSIVTR